jgi:phospholipase C
MTDTRRDFFKKAALLTGSAAMTNMLPPVIQKALAVNPEPGSTYLDAEHIVFLMQENRSFDHEFGMLQGVRGYNDPRAIRLANKNKVFLQSDTDGQTYAPFHLSVKDSKIAWMGSLPHGWSDQTDAWNEGKYDRWLEVKKTRAKDYAAIPRTLGYCDRSDFPFYYSLADAFTVCDQHFCSSITGTHPNRYYWMTGTVRERNEVAAKATLWNVSNYDKPELGWTTFPERLEDQGVSWKVYQNELTLGSTLKGEEENWLGNFGTNVLEYFKQYNVRLHASSVANLQAKKENIQKTIAELEKAEQTDAVQQKLAAARKVQSNIDADLTRYTKEAFDQLNTYQQGLNKNAFHTNLADADFHSLSPLEYEDKEGNKRSLNIPKGDVFHEFRKDVENGTLPTVSWLMPPAYFSDHPGEPWFGPWYVSEVMEILLKNPEVWKKTIFVMTYDENDGYFDHVPPFVVPHPYKEHSGKVSEGIDPRMDFVTKEQQTNPSAQADRLRESAIGLGYRVPLVIASPWSRGGYVNSEVFDHTSSLQFLENFLAKKFNKKVKEENITEWRRTICGDLTSVFRPYNGEKIESPTFLEKTPFIEGIHQSQFKNKPDNYKSLTKEEVAQINNDPASSQWFPQQEKGVRPANALPYELYADATVNDGKFSLAYKAGNMVFGANAAGAPICVYAINPYDGETLRTWNYSAKAGDTLKDEWEISKFADGAYHLRAYGPNGFYREFMGTANHPEVKVACTYEGGRMNKAKLTGNILITITNTSKEARTVQVADNSYKTGKQVKTIAPGASAEFTLNLSKSYNWYDCSVKVKGYDQFEERFAGRVETGQTTKTDPLMGGVV